MSLDKSRIPKLSDSSRKFIPEKQRKAMNDPFVTSNERPTQDTHATGRCDSRNRSHASQGRNNLSDSDMRENPNPEPLSGGNDTQAGHSRDAISMATAFEHLNRSLETFLTRISRTNEHSEESRRVFKKPKCHKDESDCCIDTWIEEFTI